ncbi:hypothetical protein [Aliagarivorans taiwanensis]|uniref:hypothetical protein n=1 Tax=Aliagarivorans taiwanensis TaxID=561966 RepID=UPI0003FC10A4|nr:hypothetical protein [Aliagarivorans taiwanensis]
MKNLYRREGGIALLQVLLMVAVISVLALQMSYSSKDKVAVAQALQDKVLAEVDLRTLESELLYELATKRWVNGEEGEIATEWNFYGKPFITPSGHRVSIQDNDGLVSVFNGGSRATVEPLLTQMLGARHRAVSVRNQLIELQGFVSGSSSEMSGQFFQSRSELTNALSEAGLEEDDVLLFTRIPNRAFLPLQAPDRLLRLWLPERQAEAIIELRSKGRMDAASFRQITGIHSSDEVRFYPSGRFMIELVVNKGTSRALKRMFINMSPLSNTQPIWFFGVEG